MSLNRRRSSPFKRFVLLTLLLVLAGAGGAAFVLFFEGKPPRIDLTQFPEYLKQKNNLVVEVSDEGSGIKSLVVTASQGGVTTQLYAGENPRTSYTQKVVGPLNVTQQIAFDIERLGFTEGSVDITVTASDFSLRGMLSGNSVSATRSLLIDSRPPRLKIVHRHRYIKPGSSGMIIYQNDDKESSHGVMVNGWFNKGFPVGDGDGNVYVSYFTLPYDADEITESFITATDIAGNKAVLPFSMTFKPARQKKDKIGLSDNFFNKKIPEFEQLYPRLSGSLLEKYLTVNREVRQENNKKIAAICNNTTDEKLWEGRFIRMAGAAKAGFADYRTYFYNGQPVDKQVHLGSDIASVANAKVKAANRGRVVYSDYLGIYGNMIMLDHGQGVFSLYSHLYQMNVAEGDMVEQGDVIGLTGKTGMAGGDHLHFSMLVNGVFAHPKEWWDASWIAVNIEEPLLTIKF